MPSRIKCVSNLRQFGLATLSFSQENDYRTPWNLTPSQSSDHYGSAAGTFDGGASAGDIFGLAAMKTVLQTPNILVSPCDEARMADNETLRDEWHNINTKDGNPVTIGTSYIFCRGGDHQRPATVVALTRNLASNNIAAGGWSGADESPPPQTR